VENTNQNKIKAEKQRFQYIDQFRGLIGILMLLGHSSYYFNAIWNQLDPFDPLFPSWRQFALRYIGYLCAPGFLMMNGAMVWWSYHQRREKGVADWPARWHLIQRGLFLVVAQMTWVNSSWGGFRTFDPWHLGIIACIGISMIFLTFIVNAHWAIRLGAAILLLMVHPLLLKISYDTDILWEKVLMQTFVDSGDFNKYPVMPWFALALLGSVMANAWIKLWENDKKRILLGITIAVSTLLIATVLRLAGGFGNIFPTSVFGSYSFLIDQKYPPSLFMNLWFFALVVLGVTLFIFLGRTMPRLVSVFSIPGKVPLFFYGVHLAILGIFIKRLDFMYRDGDVWASIVGLAAMLAVMLPLCKWFYSVKRKSKNYIIQMI
jgi:uncharacterized membrane protein